MASYTPLQARELLRKEAKFCLTYNYSYEGAYDYVTSWISDGIKCGYYDEWEIEDMEELEAFKNTLLDMWFKDF